MHAFNGAGAPLQGRTVLVVGAGSRRGIGYACAALAASAGACAALADLDVNAVARLAETLHGGPHSFHALDATNPERVDAVVAAIHERHGRIDGAILAHGILRNEPFLDISLDAWDETFAVNTRSVFLVGQAVARRMAAQRRGRIVLVASNSGRVPRLETASYGASKAAVIHLARCMALELAPYAITVNALCPGSTATSMMVDNQAKGDPKRLEGVVMGSLEQWRTGIPLGRLAEPQDQANAAIFLLSDAARHITGQALCVDGGQTFF